MFDTEFRAILEKYKLMLAKMVPKSISANDISVISSVLVLVGCVCYYYKLYILGFVFGIFSVILDGIDGKDTILGEF